MRSVEIIHTRFHPYPHPWPFVQDERKISWFPEYLSVWFVIITFASVAKILLSPCTASSQAFSVNAFRWGIRDERPRDAKRMGGGANKVHYGGMCKWHVVLAFKSNLFGWTFALCRSNVRILLKEIWKIFEFFPWPPVGGKWRTTVRNIVCYSFSFSGMSCELFPYPRFIISGRSLRVASGCLVMTTKCTHLTTLKNVAADAVFCEDRCCWSTGRRRFWLALYMIGCPVREETSLSRVKGRCNREYWETFLLREKPLKAMQE